MYSLIAADIRMLQASDDVGDLRLYVCII
jgi:hypothetical protein